MSNCKECDCDKVGFKIEVAGKTCQCVCHVEAHTEGWVKEAKRQMIIRGLSEKDAGYIMSEICREVDDLLKQEREAERAKCKKIFMEEVDWAEWGREPEEVSEQFDEARALLEETDKES